MNDALMSTMAEACEEVWRGEVFPKTSAEALASDGQEQVTLPTGYNIIQLASRLIGNKPGIDVPPLDVTKEADESAEKCERWLTAMWQAVNRQQERNIIDDAKFWTFLRGRNVFDVPLGGRRVTRHAQENASPHPD